MCHITTFVKSYRESQKEYIYLDASEKAKAESRVEGILIGYNIAIDSFRIDGQYRKRSYLFRRKR